MNIKSTRRQTMKKIFKSALFFHFAELIWVRIVIKDGDFLQIPGVKLKKVTPNLNLNIKRTCHEPIQTKKLLNSTAIKKKCFNLA